MVVIGCDRRRVDAGLARGVVVKLVVVVVLLYDRAVRYARRPSSGCCKDVHKLLLLMMLLLLTGRGPGPYYVCPGLGSSLLQQLLLLIWIGRVTVQRATVTVFRV